jgi:hypothetical protein
MNAWHLSRRTFLRGAGVAVGLPLLDAMAAEPAAEARRRLVAINLGLGLHGPNILPERGGRDYESTPYLDLLEDFRDRFTVFSGVSHPGVGGGHHSYKSFLTAARHPGSAGFKNSISLDQLAAERLGVATRYASLSLSTQGPGLSWSRSGVEVPTVTRPSQVFERLFLEGKPAEKSRQIRRLDDGQSVLDVVAEQAASMQRRLGGRDRDKLDQYFTAIRDAEGRLAKARAWEDRPKPQPGIAPPRDENDPARMVQRFALLLEMTQLAIATDSTRFVTINEPGMNRVPEIDGVNTDYHVLSHHGKDPAKIAQLTIVETELVKTFGRFLGQLEAGREDGSSLLDSTMVLFGSNLGNASSHDTRNMPMLLAGGGFRHGQHLAFDRQANYPLPRVYVSMLQRLGLETDSFADSTGSCAGLELA